MSTTREDIIDVGDRLIRRNGFNSFSYYDISKQLGVKHTAVHYHFPKKADFGVAVLNRYRRNFDRLTEAVRGKSSAAKLEAFLNIFSKPYSEKTVCIIGALSPDAPTFAEEMQSVLQDNVNHILSWLTQVLESGLTERVMHFQELPRTKALLIITNMTSALALTRMTGHQDFESIKIAILESTLKSKPT